MYLSFFNFYVVYKYFLLIKKQMVSKSEIIMVASNVDFEINNDSHTFGSFLLMSSNDVLRFEWKAENPTDNYIIPNVVTFSIFQINKIIRRDISFKKVAIRFILSDNSRLPLFIFTEFPHIFVSHLLEYLANKQIIIVLPDKLNVFKVFSEQVNYDENKPLEYSLPTGLPANMTINIATHNSILHNLGFQPLIRGEINIGFEEFKDKDFENVKKRIFLSGIKPESRPFIWPYLLRVYPKDTSEEEIRNILNLKKEEYLTIFRQRKLFTKHQKENSNAVKDILVVLENDIKRTDRNLEEFQDLHGPYLNLLRNVLITYSLFNKDIGYVQGMCDIASIFVLLYIKGWKDEKALFYDGTYKTKEEAESFVFWNFVNFLDITKQSVVFSDLGFAKEFLLKRTCKIIKYIHKPLNDFISNQNFSELIFMFGPLLLLFKRQFVNSELLRLWDSIITSDLNSYPRFITASLVILIYPKFLIHTDGTLGQLSGIMDNYLENVNVNSVINLTNSLLNEINNSQIPKKEKDYIFEPIFQQNTLKEYKSHYLKLK